MEASYAKVFTRPRKIRDEASSVDYRARRCCHEAFLAEWAEEEIKRG